MNPQLLRFDNTLEHDPAIEAWFLAHHNQLGAIANQYFNIMRSSGDEVRELLHDGCPTACLGDIPFAYVNVFTAHANIGFFQGAGLPDPSRLLEGKGKLMRHVKLRPHAPIHHAALIELIHAAYSDIKRRIETGYP